MNGLAVIAPATAFLVGIGVALIVWPRAMVRIAVRVIEWEKRVAEAISFRFFADICDWHLRFWRGDGGVLIFRLVGAMLVLAGLGLLLAVIAAGE